MRGLIMIANSMIARVDAAAYGVLLFTEAEKGHSIVADISILPSYHSSILPFFHPSILPSFYTSIL